MRIEDSIMLGRQIQGAACRMQEVQEMASMPVRPVSSSMVNRHSRGGSLADVGMSSRASAAATPMPLSAPRVVPSAWYHRTNNNDNNGQDNDHSGNHSNNRIRFSSS